MMPHRLKKHRQRQHPGDSHMALVPFIDMMTILVVFLLIHMSDSDMVPNTKNISIPQSVSQTKPRATVVVMVTKDEVLVDGRSVVSIAEVRAETSPVVQALRLALTSQADRVLAEAAQDSRRKSWLPARRPTTAKCRWRCWSARALHERPGSLLSQF
jgi:biopolymer transport protein TolR